MISCFNIVLVCSESRISFCVLVLIQHQRHFACDLATTYVKQYFCNAPVFGILAEGVVSVLKLPYQSQGCCYSPRSACSCKVSTQHESLSTGILSAWFVATCIVISIAHNVWSVSAALVSSLQCLPVLHLISSVTELPWDQPTVDCPEYLAWKDGKSMGVTPWTKLDNMILSLVRKILVPLPSGRYTIQRIKNHRWFQKRLQKSLSKGI